MTILDPGFAGDGLYRELILDHYKHPRKQGKLEGATFTHRELNPLCGDEITFSLLLRDGRVADARFQGKGCAISQAAASLLAESLPGRAVAEVQQMQRAQMFDLLGISVGPARVKCAMLGLVAVKQGISSSGVQATGDQAGGSRGQHPPGGEHG